MRSYGIPFHDICWPVYFKFATRGCDRKPPIETNLPKIMKQKSFNAVTIEFKHSSYPQELIFVF